MLYRPARLALLAVLTGGLLVSAAGIATADVSPDQQAAVLAAHNTLRRNTAAAETQRLGQTITIPDLTWNPAAAGVAQAWANNLLATNTFEHNPNAGNFGENIYMESGSDPATSGTRAVGSWAAEVASYTWDTNACTDECGHYTQLVWAGTTSVGCGVATNGTDTYWVCDYAPAGNFNGQRPYEPAGGATGTTAPPAATGRTAAPPTQPPAAVTTMTLTGSWAVDDFGAGAGGTLRLVQNGTKVTGTYSYADPSGCGTESGTLTGTVAGGILSFSTVETGCGGDGGGAGTLMMSADGGSFDGDWSGTRTGP